MAPFCDAVAKRVRERGLCAEKVMCSAQLWDGVDHMSTQRQGPSEEVFSLFQ